MKNKKASHVGIILSFVIFVTFLVFLFSILGSPLKLPSNKEPLIDYLNVEMFKRFSANLTILTITPGNTGASDCIRINNNDLEFQDLYAVVKDKNGVSVSSKPDKGPTLDIDLSGEKDFFRIYYSEEILTSSGNPTCNSPYILVTEDISSIRESQYFYKKKITDFIDTYDSEYDNYKILLNLPLDNEFGLSFNDSNGDTITKGDTDSAVDIFSREIPIQYFDESANINSGFINIRVW